MYHTLILSTVLMIVCVSCQRLSSLNDLATKPNAHDYFLRVEAIPPEASANCLSEENFETLKYLNPFDGASWLRVTYSPCLKFNIFKMKRKELAPYRTRTMYASQIPEIAQDLFCSHAKNRPLCLKNHQRAISAAIGYVFHLIFPHQSLTYQRFSSVRKIKIVYIPESDFNRKAITTLVEKLSTQYGNGHQLFTVPVQAWVSLLVSKIMVHGQTRLSHRRIAAQRIIRRILKRKLAEEKKFVGMASLPQIKKFSRGCARLIDDICLTFPCSLAEARANTKNKSNIRNKCITPIKDIVQFYTTLGSRMISIPLKITALVAQDANLEKAAEQLANFQVRDSTPPRIVIDPLWASDTLETLMEFYDIRP